jgi:hypothetical protein
LGSEVQPVAIIKISSNNRAGVLIDRLDPADIRRTHNRLNDSLDSDRIQRKFKEAWTWMNRSNL